jgi:anti-sigma regulatory factor (Ser/Thr protein kinase)
MPSRFRSEPDDPDPGDLGDRGDPDHDTGELRLVALPTAVACARQFGIVQLRKWDLDDLADATTLVISELITNSIRATGNPMAPNGYADLHDRRLTIIILRLRFTQARLFCEVWDASDDPPLPGDADDFAESGRGLQLVGAFTSDWGSYPSAMGGKVVWASWELPT